MSLMRLLSVSRSFCSNVPEMGRYKLSKRGSLPDFGRRADVTTTTHRATQGELAIGTVLRRKAETQRTAFKLEYDGVAPQAAAAVGSVAAASPFAAKSVPPVSEAKEGFLARWLGWLALRWSAWTRPRTRRRRSRRGPVQTDFQLETVRVVRNDLTESDLEMVVMRSRRNGGVDPAGHVDGLTEVKRPLARLAARLFTAGRP